jgi:hypothetical protein
MRVVQSNTSFNPVTITLDSQEEVDAMIEIAGMAYSHADINSAEELLASQIRDELRSGGWQSSNMSC